MSRSVDYYYSNSGWNTTSDDYSIHISRMEQMPSDLTAGFPHYPNVHTLFNNMLTIEQDGQGIMHPTDHHQKQYHGGGQDHHYKKVQFAPEHKKTTAQVADHNKQAKQNAAEVSVDSEADGFIQKKHKYFDDCKWGQTFKAY